MRRIVLTILSLLPATGIACSCSWPEEITERHVLDQLCSSDTVFVGKIESATSVRNLVFEYKIRPEESFRGLLASPVIAVSETGGMCGYPFKVGGRYLIFANARDDTDYLSASVCGLTRLLNDDDDVYTILTAKKNEIDELCGEEAVESRRLERLREKGRKRDELD